MSDDILKPCPFCGSKAEFGSIDDNEHPDFGGHFICCTNTLCQCSSALIFPLMDNVAGLLAIRWNKRRKHDASEHEPDGIALIAADRRRQIEQEGWTADEDDEYRKDELAYAAACYAVPPDAAIRQSDRPAPAMWPWHASWWKPGDGSIDGRIRELTKAGALIAAELDRLLRIKTGGEGGA